MDSREGSLITVPADAAGAAAAAAAAVIKL